MRSMPGVSVLVIILRIGPVPGSQVLGHESHSGNGCSTLFVCWAVWAVWSLHVCGWSDRLGSESLRTVSLTFPDKAAGRVRVQASLLPVIGPVAWVSHCSSLGLSLFCGKIKNRGQTI